jgi:flagellar biosynthesis protein FlhB
MKMTKQEVKEEGKQQEGDPFIKGKQREKRMKLSRARMMEGVKKAKVVITNPTHIACALRYDDDMDAPMLVAKGQHLIAKKIVEVARENNVPVIENKPVAWSIYNNVDIEEYIPAPLYPVVAEVIFYVLKLDEERKEKEL